MLPSVLDVVDSYLQVGHSFCFQRGSTHHNKGAIKGYSLGIPSQGDTTSTTHSSEATVAAKGMSCKLETILFHPDYKYIAIMLTNPINVPRDYFQFCQHTYLWTPCNYCEIISGILWWNTMKEIRSWMYLYESAKKMNSMITSMKNCIVYLSI